MTPLERAARALAYEHGSRAERFGASNRTPEAWADANWRDHVATARTVLEAIRDIDDPLSPILIAGQCTTGHWKAMIDAALAE